MKLTHVIALSLMIVALQGNSHENNESTKQETQEK